jgi:hypothetical protein
MLVVSNFLPEMAIPNRKCLLTIENLILLASVLFSGKIGKIHFSGLLRRPSGFESRNQGKYSGK